MSALAPLRWALLLAFGLAPLAPAAQSVIFVDADASGTADGSSWENAYPDLVQALQQTEITGAAQVWVAEGRYAPDAQSAGDRSQTFLIRPGVEVYGGFLGTESSIDERPRNFLTQAPTILDGDLDDDSDTAVGDAGAAYKVVTFTGEGSGGGVLDGVTVTGGRDERPLQLFGNAGFAAGVIVDTGAQGSVIRNVILRDNAAQQASAVGGLNAGYAVVNVVITESGSEAPSPTNALGSRSDFSGGNVPSPQAVTFDNVTVAENPGEIYREANATVNFVTTFENSIVYNNGTDLPGNTQLVVTDGDVTFQNTVFGPTNKCDVGVYACADVTTDDPAFRDDDEDDGFFTLTAGSSALDFGDNGLLPDGLATDAAGRARVQNGTVDAGAFEGTDGLGTPAEGGPDALGPPVQIAVAPNPAGARARVTLTVREGQDVTVTVHDALGRRVAVLHDGPVRAGAALALAFETGPLAPGVYVVRAVGPAASAAAQVVVAR